MFPMLSMLTRPKDKYMLALRCLNAARALDPKHPLVHQQSIHLRYALNAASDSLPAKSKEVIDASFKVVPADADLKKLNADFRSQHAGHPAYVLAAARTDKLLGEDKSKYENAVLNILDIKGVTLPDAIAAFNTLKQWGSGQVEVFKSKAKGIWPVATVFAV